MADRDVEKTVSRSQFVKTLRRVADAIERREPIRIQLASKRLLVPADASLSFEHEAEGRDEELELQVRWQNDGSEPAAKPRARKAGKAKPARSAKGKRKPARRA